MSQPWSEVKEAAEQAEAKAEAAWQVAFNEARSVILDEFEANGGCRLCLGRGYHRQDYHDGDSYYDQCSCAAGQRGERNEEYVIKSHPIYARLCGALWSALAAASDANSNLGAYRDCRPGDMVRVVRGRKVKIGTEGAVVAESWRHFGGRAGGAMRHSLKLDSGEWVDAANCARLIDAPAVLEVGMRYVVKLKSGATGHVFWKRDMRIGIRATRTSEPVWANVTDVTEIVSTPFDGEVAA